MRAKPPARIDVDKSTQIDVRCQVLLFLYPLKFVQFHDILALLYMSYHMLHYNVDIFTRMTLQTTVKLSGNDHVKS